MAEIKSSPEIHTSTEGIPIPSNTMDVEKDMSSAGYDEATKVFSSQEGELEVEFGQKEANRVRWKLDLILLPMMTITYILNFLDKSILSQAAVYGLLEDLNLVDQQYSWIASIFYFGYLVWQYPNSIFMQKLPLGRWIGAMVFLWGMCVAAGAGATNFATLAVSRFFLGVFEASNNPVFTLIVSQYYTRKEHAFRSCIWWAGGAVGAFIADAISFGVGHLHGKLSRWQYLFLIFGPITMAWGIFLFFMMPSSPMSAWFLTPAERKIAVVRVVQNHTGLHNRQYKLYQVRQCLRDPQVWMLVSIAFLQCIPSGGLTAFNKIIITGLGYSPVRATIMAMPEHAIQLVSVLLAGYICSVYNKGRCIAMILSNICVLVGSVLLYTLPTSHKLSRLGAVYSLLTCTVSYALCMSMVASNFAGFTKKMTAAVMMFLGYCVGQIVAPQFFISSQSPTYPTGFRAYFASAGLMIVIQASLMTYLILENHRRDTASSCVESTNEGTRHRVLETDLMDLTDWEQPNFRYVW